LNLRRKIGRNFQFTEFRVADFNLPISFSIYRISRRRFQFTDFVSQFSIYRISRRRFQFTGFVSQFSINFTEFRVADFNLPNFASELASQFSIYRISRRNFQLTEFVSHFQFSGFRVTDFNLRSSRRKFQFTKFVSHVSIYWILCHRFQFSTVGVATFHLLDFVSQRIRVASSI